MELKEWIKLLGKDQNDSKLKALFKKAGVEKIPKVDRDDSSVIFEIKKYGLWLEMTAEAKFKKIMEKKQNEGPLILTSVEAVLLHHKSKNLYKGLLPFKLKGKMTQAELRKTLGAPGQIVDDVPADIWMHDGFKLNVTYTKDGLLFQTLAVGLPLV